AAGQRGGLLAASEDLLPSGLPAALLELRHLVHTEVPRRRRAHAGARAVRGRTAAALVASGQRRRRALRRTSHASTTGAAHTAGAPAPEHPVVVGPKDAEVTVVTSTAASGAPASSLDATAPASEPASPEATVPPSWPPSITTTTPPSDPGPASGLPATPPSVPPSGGLSFPRACRIIC